MNDVQSLMTAAAILAMGGLGLFMYKGDEDVIRDTPVEKQEIQEKTDEVAFEKSEQNFVPFFSRSNEKGELETKPKKTRKMRKRSGGGSRRSMSNF
jgi:hypothetical protein